MKIFRSEYKELTKLFENELIRFKNWFFISNNFKTFGFITKIDKDKIIKMEQENSIKLVSSEVWDKTMYENDNGIAHLYIVNANKVEVPIPKLRTKKFKNFTLNGSYDLGNIRPDDIDYEYSEVYDDFKKFGFKPDEVLETLDVTFRLEENP